MERIAFSEVKTSRQRQGSGWRRIPSFQLPAFGLRPLMLFLTAVLLFILSSCAQPQWRREHLSDPIMQFNGDNFSEQHVYPLKEGSAGGYGSEGGGCGC